MSAWKKMLASLDDRAKGGKTASALISAAEDEFAELRSVIEKKNEYIETLEGRVSRQEMNIKGLEARVDKLLNPRIRTDVENESIGYTFSRAQGGWRLSEMESALTHLRLAGGGDDTLVEITAGDNLQASVVDLGQGAMPWRREPARQSEQENPRRRRSPDVFWSTVWRCTVFFYLGAGTGGLVASSLLGF